MQTFGEYNLNKLIARGGMAEVYLSTRQGLDRRIAIKRILPHMSDNPEFRTMFWDEARLVAGLDHPNIVQVFDMGQVGKRLFMAMEFIDGQSLKDLIEDRGALPVPLAAHIAGKVSLGLDYAHNRIDSQGKSLDIIHRDISPQNIMLTADGRVKIVDFGIAKATTNVYRTKAYSLKGKVKYMSPEQVRADSRLDRRTDVYSTGVVLFEMLAGRPPHDADSELELMTRIVHQDAPDLRELRSDIPEDLLRILSTALQRDREARYASSRDLQAALTRFMSRQGWRIQEAQVAEYLDSGDLHLPRMPQLTQRNLAPLGQGEEDMDDAGSSMPLKAILGIAAGLLLLLGGLAFFLLSQADPAPPPKPEQALQVDTAWAETGARQRAEQLRAERQRAFDKHWSEGQRSARQPAQLLAALQHLRAAEQLVKDLKLDDELRAEVIRLRAETQRAFDAQEKEAAARRKQEELEAAKRKQEEEREAARLAEEEEAQAQRERVRASAVRFPALKPIEAISAEDKSQSRSLRSKGERAHKSNRIQQALNLYRRAMELNPRDFELYRLMGMAHSYAGRRGKANTCFKRYVQLCPQCADAPTARKLIEAYQSLVEE